MVWKAIGAILDRPGFDEAQAQQEPWRPFQPWILRYEGSLGKTDKTIPHAKGRATMGMEELFEGFDGETQQRYELEAAQRWGGDKVRESRRRWTEYSAERRAAIFAEAGQIYRGLAACVEEDPAGAEAQKLIAAWHQNLRNFYEPNREILLGLAQGYAEDPRFGAFFSRLHPGLPAFLRQAIDHYCRNLPATEPTAR